MTAAVRDCMVTGYANLVDGIDLPDADDKHVVAAAIRAGAQAIVTFNTKDFPARSLADFDIEPTHPDEFLLDLLDLDEALVARVVSEQAADLRHPPHPVSAVLAGLENLRLVGAVARLRDLLA